MRAMCLQLINRDGVDKMYRFVLNKMKNKKWLNICLLMGVTLFISLFVCHPMFEKGAGSRMLNTLFEKQAEKENTFPATMKREGTYKVAEYKSAKAVLDKLTEYEKKWTEYVDIDTVSSQKLITLSGGRGNTSLGGTNHYFAIGYMPDLAKHTDVVQTAETNGDNVQISGQKNDNSSAADIYECSISEKTMDHYGLVAGEVIYMQFSLDGEKKEIPFVISQIRREKDINAPYWAQTLSDMGDTLLVSQEVFDDMMQYFKDDSITYTDSLMLDYRQINTENAKEFNSYIAQFKAADKLYSDNLATVFSSCFKQLKTVRLMLWALELPCLVLLLLFIKMIAEQLLKSEENDIVVLKSRGASNFQVILLYLEQAVLIAVAGCVAGGILGYIMCMAAASTDGFMHFVIKDISTYKFVWQMAAYAIAAGSIMILFMTVPVWKKSVNAMAERGKNHYVVKKKSMWEKGFIDVILLLVSVYLLYNYNKQRDTISISVLEQKSIDPVLILDTSLFIFSAALFCVRLTGSLIVLFDKLFKRRFSPEIYASFLQLKRTRYRQGFLAVFLIMTVAGGIFDANMARTINSNIRQRIVYDTGADVTCNESFKLRIMRKADATVSWMYGEPDFGRYEELVNNKICDSVTRVLTDDNVDIDAGGESESSIKLMAVNTKEFGQTAVLQENNNDTLNDRHWFYELNALAKEPDGVIISSNLAARLKLKVSDTINYSRYAPKETGKDSVCGSAQAKVCAILDAFPGYDRYTYDADENYLIVANYATVVEKFGVTPYSVWMKLCSGRTDDDIEKYLSDDGERTLIFADRLITEEQSSAIVQVTNGMFTLSFILSLIVCAVGFLLYWIMSLKQREQQLGIFRAMGMSVMQVKKMIINEQFFLSFIPIIAGTVTGMAATALFVRLISIIYLPKKHTIPINVCIDRVDMAELAVLLLAVIFVCLAVISRLLKSMKISQALRLGDD